jgi:hypothetical protein
LVNKRGHGIEQGVSVGDPGEHFVASVGQQPDEALEDDGSVFRDHDVHGPSSRRGLRRGVPRRGRGAVGHGGVAA